MVRFLTTAVIFGCFSVATPQVTDYVYHVDDGHHDDDHGHGVQTVVRAGGPTAGPQKITSCQTRSIDLVFLIDANGHQSKRNYDKMMDVANEIAFDNIDVSSGFGINQKPTVRLSFVVYGEVSSNSFDYATSTTFGINEVLEAQDQTLLGPYYHTVKSKHLLNALSYINGNIFSKVQPEEATPVLVIFHTQTSDRINRAIRLLDKNEVQIFAIGLNDKFGNEANTNQLSFMADKYVYDLGAMKDYGLQYTDYFYSKQSSRQKRSHLATNPQQGQSTTKRTLRLISRNICEASKMVLGGKSLSESTNSSTEVTIDPTVPVKRPCFVQTYLSPQIMTKTEYNQRLTENGFSPKSPKNKESNRHQNVWENALDYPITIFKIAHSKESELTEIKAGSTRYAKPKPMRKKKKQRNNESGDAESETEIFMREGESIIIKACETGSCDAESVVILAYVEPVDSYFMKLDGKKIEFFQESCDNQADPSVADCKDWYQQAMQIEGMILDENHICYDIMPKEPVEETTMPVPQAEKESCGQYCQNNFDQLVYWSKNDEPVVCEIDDDYTNHYANYADHNESDTTVATYDRSLPNMNSDETDENGYSLYPTDNYHEDSAGETGCPSCIVQPYPVRVYTEEEAAHSSQARSYYVNQMTSYNGNGEHVWINEMPWPIAIYRRTVLLEADDYYPLYAILLPGERVHHHKKAIGETRSVCAEFDEINNMTTLENSCYAMEYPEDDTETIDTQNMSTTESSKQESSKQESSKQESQSEWVFEARFVLRLYPYKENTETFLVWSEPVNSRTIMRLNKAKYAYFKDGCSFHSTPSLASCLAWERDVEFTFNVNNSAEVYEHFEENDSRCWDLLMEHQPEKYYYKFPTTTTTLATTTTTEIDPCYTEPCQNDGVCNGFYSNGTSPAYFACDCQHGYKGDTCEEIHHIELFKTLKNVVESRLEEKSEEIEEELIRQEKDLEQILKQLMRLTTEEIEMQKPKFDIFSQNWPEAHFPTIVYQHAGNDLCLGKKLWFHRPDDVYKHTSMKFVPCERQETVIQTLGNQLVVKDKECLMQKNVPAHSDCNKNKCIVVSTQERNASIHDCLYDGKVFVELHNCDSVSRSEKVKFSNFKFNDQTGQIHIIGTKTDKYSDDELCLDVDITGKNHGYRQFDKAQFRLVVDYCKHGFTKSAKFGRPVGYVAAPSQYGSYNRHNGYSGGAMAYQQRSGSVVGSTNTDIEIPPPDYVQ